MIYFQLLFQFSDLLKRPLDTFKYLLMTMETKNINLGGIQTELDAFFIGSTNEYLHLTRVDQLNCQILKETIENGLSILWFEKEVYTCDLSFISARYF